MTRKLESTDIECNHNSLVNMCGSVLAFLMSLIAVTSMCIIAGGSFWAARSMARLTDGVNRLQLVECCPQGVDITSCLGAATCPI